MKKLEWKTEKRKVNDLLPFKINPRKITDEKKERLIKSLKKFNLSEIPLINKDGVLISGNQRIKILQELGRGGDIIDVRVPNRLLNEKEVKELNITSNTHAGEFDFEILQNDFQDIDLSEFDLSFEEKSSIEIMEKELKPYKMTHILISFPPQYFSEIQTQLEQILKNDFIEYEQSSN